MYGCKSWTAKKAEHWRIDAFELWCWRRLLRVPWTARISNQSILKEISPECSLEGLMLKLKLQYFSHLMQRTDLFEKTLILGKMKAEEGDEARWAYIIPPHFTFGYQLSVIIDFWTNFFSISFPTLCNCLVINSRGKWGFHHWDYCFCKVGIWEESWA